MFGWLFGRKHVAPQAPRSVEATAWVLNGRGSVEVVGESHYQPAIRAAVQRWQAAGGHRPDELATVTAALVLEPDNPYDPLAVVVHIDGCGRVGYLSRTDARAYRPVLQQLAARRMVAACTARIYGGVPGKPSYGVWLNLAEPARAFDEGDE